MENSCTPKITQQPNILFLMVDQMQGRVLHKDNPCLAPNFDKLAQEGMVITQAYTPNPVCSPARASLMTGLLPHNHGVLQVTHTTDDDMNVLRIAKSHWAQHLAADGYQTAYFGKWHVERSNQLERFGWQVNGELSTALYKQRKEALHPDQSDKDSASASFKLAKYNEYPEGYKKTLLYAVTETPLNQRSMQIAASLANDFLDDALQSEKPWCCFVSITEPHDPFICGEEAYALYDVDSLELPPNVHDDLTDRPGLYRKAARIWNRMTDRERKEAMACYYASITEIDQVYGSLIDKLTVSGKMDNTIVVLTSDHGELLGAHGLYVKNISAGEEVYNIPLIITGPGITKNHRSNARVGLHDLGPTLLELTRSEPIEGIDSTSFAPLLRNPSLENQFTTGFAENYGGRVWLTQRIVWNGSWKFIFNGFDEDELYNLEEDPYELHNLIGIAKYEPVVRQLCGLMWEKILVTNDHSLIHSYYASLRLAPFGPY